MISASIARRITNLVRPRVSSSTCLTIDEWMDFVTDYIEKLAKGGSGSGGQFVPPIYRAEIAARLRVAGYRVHETTSHDNHLSIHWEDES